MPAEKCLPQLLLHEETYAEDCQEDSVEEDWEGEYSGSEEERDRADEDHCAPRDRSGFREQNGYRHEDYADDDDEVAREEEGKETVSHASAKGLAGCAMRPTSLVMHTVQLHREEKTGFAHGVPTGSTGVPSDVRPTESAHLRHLPSLSTLRLTEHS